MTFERPLLMIPGPVPVADRIFQAMSRPILAHRTDDYRKILREAVEGYKWLVHTEGDAYIIAGSGTAAMDCAVVNTVESNDKVINIGGGKFGERFVQITKRYTTNQIDLPVEWGKAADLEKLESLLSENPDTKIVTFTMNETSTGVLHPAQEIAKIAHKFGSLVVVDGITVVGGDYLYQDDWGLDVVVSGSQKCMGLPPGLGFISVTKNVWDTIQNRRTPVPSYYLDLQMMKKKWDAAKDTPFTSATHLILGLRESLEMMREEGYKNRVERHRLLAKMSRAGYKALGLELFADPQYFSNTVTAVKYPQGIDDNFRKEMKKLGVIVAGAQDHISGKVFRTSSMNILGVGEIIQTLAITELALSNLGYKVPERGAGVMAALEEYSTT
ncbi:MAG: pyridoxal-phosphate-dependent aminotransferase family protein [Candidatus Ranarchaeia archaeon]|jgi:aspartate aminotransferase-like enzyme